MTMVFALPALIIGALFWATLARPIHAAGTLIINQTTDSDIRIL